MNIRYCETKVFSAKQLEALFLSVGWESGRYPDKLVRAMRGSSRVISAWDGERLVGLVRSLDDGESVAFLHYLLVHPAYQGKHIGANLIERILKPYRNYMYIKLMPSDPQTVPFYEKFGFRCYDNYTVMQIARL